MIILILDFGLEFGVVQTEHFASGAASVNSVQFLAQLVPTSRTCLGHGLDRVNTAVWKANIRPMDQVPRINQICSTFRMVRATSAKSGLHAGNMKFSRQNEECFR
jgi:hypothetical protein